MHTHMPALAVATAANEALGLAEQGVHQIGRCMSGGEELDNVHTRQPTG